MSNGSLNIQRIEIMIDFVSANLKTALYTMARTLLGLGSEFSRSGHVRYDELKRSTG
jgi:hypothetical protein